MVERYRHYQPNRQSREVKRKKPKHYGRRLLLILIICVGLYIGVLKLRSTMPHVQDPKKSQGVTSQPVIKKVSQATWDHIDQVVGFEVAANPSLNIAVSLVDVKTNTAKDFGDQETFAGASTTKVLTAAAYMKQVEQGEKTLDQSINGISAQSHIQKMINQSNNESWAALNSAVGRAELETYAHSIGMQSYLVEDNTLKAKDEALLLNKLANGTLISKELQALLYSYMQNTNNEDMIPAVIPAGAIIHHKYGQLEDRLHDASVINYKNRPLVLVIFTKGVPSAGGGYATRTALIQSLAQNILNIYYQNL